MTPAPTGRIDRTNGGNDLILRRTFAAPIEDVWASITEPERTARWFVSYTGEAAPGRTVQARMVLEEGQPEIAISIVVCEPPHHLVVRGNDDDYGTWHLEARLAETAGTTVLTFVQHLDEGADAGSIGPGWEYYLDALVASRGGSPMPDFADYYPSQQAYYQSQAAG